MRHASGPRPLHRGRRNGRREQLGLLAGEQHASLALVLGAQQAGDRRQRHVGERGDLVAAPADARPDRQAVVGPVGERDDDAPEAERVPDPAAHREQHLLDRAAPREPGGDAQQMLDGGAVAVGPRGRLGVLDSERRVVADRAQDLELGVGGPVAADRVVHGDDAEKPARRGAHGDEQRVLGMPVLAGVVLGGREAPGGRRHVGDGALRVPLELALGDEVGAAALEPRVEQRLPALPAARGAEEHAATLVAAVDDRDLEVVPRRPVEVDDDRAESERDRDDAGDRLEQGLEVAAAAHGARDLQQAAQTRERTRLAGQWKVVRGRRGHRPGYRPGRQVLQRGDVRRSASSGRCSARPPIGSDELRRPAAGRVQCVQGREADWPISHRSDRAKPTRWRRSGGSPAASRSGARTTGPGSRRRPPSPDRRWSGA